MNTEQVIEMLVTERTKLEKVIEILQGESLTETASVPKKKGTMSEAGKERIRAALRKRHAAAKLAKEAALSAATKRKRKAS